MKIVINIDDKMYEDIKDGYTCPEYADDIINLIPTSEIYERPQGEAQDKKIEAIIEELESRKDYGTEYAQAMEDVIVILKAQFGIK